MQPGPGEYDISSTIKVKDSHNKSYLLNRKSLSSTRNTLQT